LIIVKEIQLNFRLSRLVEKVIFVHPQIEVVCAGSGEGPRSVGLRRYQSPKGKQVLPSFPRSERSKLRSPRCAYRLRRKAWSSPLRSACKAALARPDAIAGAMARVCWKRDLANARRLRSLPNNTHLALGAECSIFGQAPNFCHGNRA
jgi:hypothetical protein